MINLNCCSQDEYDKWIGKLVRVIKITEYHDYYFVVNKRKEGLAYWTKVKEEGDIFIVPSSYCLLEHLDLQTIDRYSIYLQEVENEVPKVNHSIINNLLSNMHDIPPEFDKLIADNFWDLI